MVDAGDIENRRHDVADVEERMVKLARVTHLAGKLDHERRSDPTFGNERLE